MHLISEVGIDDSGIEVKRHFYFFLSNSLLIIGNFQIIRKFESILQ